MFGAIKNWVKRATPVKRATLVVACFLLAINSSAQILNPIKWSFEWVATSETEALFRAKARIDKGWHLYAQEMNIDDGMGPERTVFTFHTSKDWQRLGKVVERSKVYEEKAEVWEGLLVRYFKNEAVFEQKFKVKRQGARLKGNVYAMVCDDKQCLPPEETEFDLVFSPASAQSGAHASTAGEMSQGSNSLEANKGAAVSDGRLRTRIQDGLRTRLQNGLRTRMQDEPRTRMQNVTLIQMQWVAPVRLKIRPRDEPRVVHCGEFFLPDSLVDSLRFLPHVFFP